MPNQSLSISSEVIVSSVEHFLQKEAAAVETCDEQSLEGDCPSFPICVFPEKIQRIALTLHQDEGLNLDYLCASMFTVLAAAMGNQWMCQFTSTWQSVPIIFMVLVGPPSCGKTPPLKLAVKPFHLYDGELERTYRLEKERYDRAMELPRDEREASGLDADPIRPVCRSVLTINSTIEALYDVLNQNRRGVLMPVDELDSFLSNTSRYNRGNDDAYWLQLFNGDTEMPSWNMRQAPLYILDEWNGIVRSILEVPSQYDSNGDVLPQLVTFSANAKTMLFRWQNTESVKAWKESGDDYLRGFCGKQETYIVRFCLIIQVVRSFCDDHCSRQVIDEDSVRAAIELTEYFRKMEEKAYSFISCSQDNGKGTMLFSLLPEEFKASEAQSKGRSLGISESTVKRFLKRCCAKGILSNPKHGLYQKVIHKEKKEHVTQ